MASNKITKKDLNEMAVRSMAEQCCFSFERMQAVGFCYGMTKCFRKIHGDNNEEMAAALKNNLDFINTEPHMAAILQGLIVSMEEAGQDRTMIHSLKTGLFGPLAGLGDAIWWYTAMPIIASICCSLATQNNVLGPIFYILFWALTAIFSRIWFVRLGYNAGVNSIKFIGDNAAYISKAAGILGVMVVGGLIPSYVSFAFPETLVISSVSVQGIFDSIMPNILPLGFVFLLYWLFKKKNVNTMKLILLVIALSVVLSFLGIFASHIVMTKLQMEAIVPMSMVNFDENQIIANGAKIYDQRAKIESIADSIVDNGFDLLLFTSSGGSQAMLDPFAFYIRHMSRLPVENVLSANLMTGDCNRITDKTVAFLTSKSGDTAETVKAANWLKEQGVRLFAAVGKENSTLESICDDTIVYGEGRPQELVFYLLIGRILYRSGNFDAYPRFADELKNLAFALAQVRKQADAKCLKYAQDYCKEPYNIWIGSGDLWPTAYSYSMCVLEESQWIRTKSVSSPEFFHGTLELLEDDVCTTLLLTEGPTRAQDERVKAFAARHTKKLTCFDTKEYALPGISDEFRPLLSPVVMAAVLQRISKNIEVITDHSLDIRRYYRKESY